MKTSGGGSMNVGDSYGAGYLSCTKGGVHNIRSTLASQAFIGKIP